MHDLVYVDGKGENEVCHYCGNGGDLDQSKRTGIMVCQEGCDDTPLNFWGDEEADEEADDSLNLNEKEDSDMDIE